MNEDYAPVAELSGSQVRHCTAPFAEHRASVFDALETLPYSRLGGPGLERLCFEILLSQGYEPRFFGRSGQAQFGVDLLGAKEGLTDVFQSKNLASVPGATELKGYLSSFKKQWLGAASLPRPKRYVICCPALLRDSGVDAEWLRLKDEFEQETGVVADLWHRDLLDGWLKKLPDVVADLFSDRHAEAFCDLDAWAPDLFIPLRKGAAGDLRLTRYLQWRDKKRLYLHPDYEDRITGALGRSPVIVVRGSPGTGKTFTALAVAETYRDARWRTYFIDVADESVTQRALYEGIRRRLGRPSIFVLENCHENPDAVAQALRRLAPELGTDRVRVLCLMRWIPTVDESRSDDHEFFADLESRDAVQELTNDDALLISMVHFLRPDLDRLSGKPLKRLLALSGRDMLILDEVLSHIESPRDIEGLTPSILFDRLRGKYFGGRTAEELPATLRLAALAQLELRPRADLFLIPESELRSIESLCVKAGRPPRWHFLHSSAAELTLHALWSGMGVTDPIEIAGYAAQDIVAYFTATLAPGVQPPVSADALATDLLLVVRNNLALAGDEAEQELKALVMDSEPILSLLPQLRQATGFAQIMSVAAMVSHRCGAKHANLYASALFNSIAALAKDHPALTHELSLLGQWLRILKITAPGLHESVCAMFDGSRMVITIEENGTVLELFKIVQYASAGLAEELVGALDNALVDRLIARAVEQRCSIGTLHLTLFDLRKDPERKKLGEQLELAIGPVRFLHLIEQNGTVFELFRIIEHASAGLAEELVGALDDALVDRLIVRTVDQRRSIGTLHLTLFDLRKDPERKKLGERLELAIGPVRFLHLIKQNGTVSELFRIVQYASAGLAEELVGALDDALVDRLIARTVDQRRSIGTLHLTLFDLRKDPERKKLGEQLELAIGPVRFLHLIEENGTVFELFKIVQHASARLAEQLVDALEDALVDRLIAHTVDQRRSIGTLDFALRELRNDPERKKLGERLELAIGPVRFLHLIEQNGTVFELFRIVGHASAGLAEKLVGALDNALVDRLIVRTVDQQRSIGTLNFTLRELRNDPERRELGERLAEAIGVAGFWKILLGAGSAGPLIDLMRAMGPKFRPRFLAAASGHSRDHWVCLLSRGDFFQLCELLADCPDILTKTAGGERLGDAIAITTPTLLATSDWYARNSGAKRLDAAQPSGPRDVALAALDAWLAEVLVTSLSFPTLRQAVNALVLLSERLPDSRIALAARLWEMLPPPGKWALDPKQDMALPKMLVALVASPEFSDTDATRVFEACCGCLVPSLLARSRTVDIVWMLWALFACARQRWGLAPSVFVARLSAKLVEAGRDALTKETVQKANADELRAQFCLVGLLSLLDEGVDPTIRRAMSDRLGQNPERTVWSLCANRPFVPAWLALRGVDATRALPQRAQNHFLKRLASAADEYTGRDPATEYLLDDVKRRQSIG